MKQRGRKSGANLTTIQGERKRPEPPEHFSAAMAATWHQIVNALPVDWFTPDIQPLLVAYCRHIDCSNFLDREISAFEPEWLKADEGLSRYKKLTDMQASQTSVIRQLATSMRLTQQSRYTPQRAASQAGKTPGGKRPWDP